MASVRTNDIEALLIASAPPGESGGFGMMAAGNAGIVVLAFGFGGPIAGTLTVLLSLLIWAGGWLALRGDRKTKRRMAAYAAAYNREWSDQMNGTKPKNQHNLDELRRASILGCYKPTFT